MVSVSITTMRDFSPMDRLDGDGSFDCAGAVQFGEVPASALVAIMTSAVVVDRPVVIVAAARRGATGALARSVRMLLHPSQQTAGSPSSPSAAAVPPRSERQNLSLLGV
jgi:hypothetical protein